MSKKRWFFLWLLFIGYLFLGATIFYTIERHQEEKALKENNKQSHEIQAILEEHFRIQANLTRSRFDRERSIDLVFEVLSSHCGKQFERLVINSTNEHVYKWTYYNSFFFALTTLSTIGYGNLSPLTEHGKIWVIVYSLIGIPFNGIVLTHLGEFFGSKILRAHHRYKNHTYESRITLFLDIFIYLLPGVAIFILLPSVIFKYYENWTFIESIYYSFVSLTTIGYGDFVAGQTSTGSPYEVVYKIFLIVWIMFGLGYLVMILGFISRAMRSKQINKLEKKVAQTLKHTQSKIWNEFVSDVHYLRRILNELYLMKVKPVYKEKVGPTMHVSQSCPNLSEWPVLRPKEDMDKEKLEVTEGPRRRRRAFSENEQEPRLQRVLSDGALEGIDRHATFSAAGLLEPGGFIIPTAFGTGSPEESDTEECKEGGINVFSDEDILESEDFHSTKINSDSAWFLGGAPLRRAGRAMSDAHVIKDTLGQQKTWSGAESLHQYALLRAMRAKSNEWQRDEEKEMKNSDAPVKGFRRLSMAAINFFTPTNKLKKKSTDMSKDLEAGKFRRPRNSIFGKGSPKHRLSLQEQDSNTLENDLNYYSHVTGRRPSILDLFAPPHSNNTTINPVLETTSIADFIRVVNSLKAMEASRPSSPTNNCFPNPLFQQLKDPPRARGRSASSMGGQRPTKLHFDRRRFSQIPNLSSPGQDAPVFRPRAASISPVFLGMTPVDRRLRKLSVTARSSPQSSGRATPNSRFAPPSLVITSPDGGHRFSIHNVEPSRNVKDSNSKPS